MLPKIAVTVANDRVDLINRIGLSENYIMGFEGSDAKVADLRKWMYLSLSAARNRPELTMIIWDADQLSPECQAVLLKPMEELTSETNLMLVVENENQLSQTILSRGVIDYYFSEKKLLDKYWMEVRKCWSSGPSACIALSDQLPKEEVTPLLEEVILKLKIGLSTEVNEKRLAILEMALDCLFESKQTNINHKLLLDNFLMSSWKMIKAGH